MQAGIASLHPCLAARAPFRSTATSPSVSNSSLGMRRDTGLGKLQDAAKETPMTWNHGMGEVWKRSLHNPIQPLAQHHHGHH